MTTSTAKKVGFRLPILQGLLPIDWAKLPADAVAGSTLAAVAIPEVMGYSQIAGMPVITGLYTLVIPMALFALFGSSRHLVIGADSATAAILAAGLAGMATSTSPQYVALAGYMALMAAALLFLARLVRLGFLADFLSRTVLVGFLTGVGIQVALGQLSGMLGIPRAGAEPAHQLVTLIQQLSHTNLPTLAVSLVVLSIIQGLKRINEKVPAALIAVTFAIAVSYFADLKARGISVLGPVPGGLPQLGFPDGTLNWGLVQRLLPVAFSMVVVILAQSAATSRAYAARYGESFSEDMDLVGLGVANLGAGLSGTFVVNGSPTKTQIADSAGGRSQFAQITAFVLVVLVLLFLTRPLSYMPSAVLSSVVFLIGLELVDLKGMRAILTERPAEFWVAVITALTVIFIGVQQGIILAILLSLAIHTRHGYKPRNLVLTIEGGELREKPVTAPVEAEPGLLIYRFAHSMYYANAGLLSQELSKLRRAGPPRVRWICIDMSAVDDVDFSAAVALRSAFEDLRAHEVRLSFAEVSAHVRAELDVSRITGLVGKEGYFPHLADVVKAYQTQVEVAGR